MIADEIVRAVLALLKSRQQLDQLGAVIEGLTRAALAGLDINLAHITSPVALSLAQKQRLLRQLERIFKRPVRLKTAVDPDLVGGLRISLGGQVIDLSLSRQLADLGETVSYD